MRRKPQYQRTTINSVPTFEGEPIEVKVERILTNKEPITDGAPIIYTDKKDGVRPEMDIRTDRWEIAAGAMDVVHKNKAAKSEKKAEVPKTSEKKESGGDAPKSGEKS
jgi:hypothetical protein